MSKKTGKGAKWIGNTAGRRIGKDTANVLKKLSKETERKTGKKSSSSSDKVEKAARTVKEALTGVGENAGRNVAELTSQHKGRPSARRSTSPKMDKLTSNTIGTAAKENKSFADRFQEDLKNGIGSNLREARRQYNPEETAKKELETNLEAVNRKYRNAGVGGFANRDNDSDKFNFQSAASIQRMASTADRMIAGWDSIPENERVSVAEYIVQAYGINDKTRDIVMSAYQNADTNGKLQLLKTARYIDGDSADVKKMQRMAQSAEDFEKAVESDFKNTSNTEKVDNFVRNAQRAVINDYRKEEEKTKLLQDWAKDNYSFSDAIKTQISQSGAGWLAHAYDAVVMAWSDLIMAGQQDSVFDGIDPTRGMKDVRSIGDGLATAGSNVLHDLFRIAGLPISLISKASYTEEEAREITKKLMSVTDRYHDVVKETQLKLDGSGLSGAQKDIVEVVGAVIDQVPGIAMSVAAGPQTGLATFGVNAGGMYARSAYDNGATLEDAVRFGLSAAAMEMVTEKMFTGFGYMGKGFVSEATQNTVKNMLRSSGFENSVSANILKRVIAGGGEATEEMIMEIVQPYLERASYDPDATGASMDDILHSGALGFIVAEILGLPANALGVANAAKRKRNENQAERMVQAQIDDMMQDAIRRGKLSESDASNINAQIKDIRTKKGVLTGSQTKQETKTSDNSLDEIYPNFNSARKAIQEKAKNMANGESVSAYFMQDGEVKVWRSKVTNGRIGLAQEGTLTESERKSYADKAARVASATNATERTGYQLNVKNDIVRQVSELSRVFGKEVEFVNKDNAVHGYEENGKIYVNANSSQSPAVAVVAHEMTHMLEDTSSYATLRDMVYRHYGSSVESKRDEILRNYEAAGVSLDTAKNESGYDEVDTEVMAAFVEEKLLTDYDTILSTVKTDRTLGERILDWLNKVLTKITGTKEQRFLIEAREKWSRALEEEREENKKAPERTGERERYSVSDEFKRDIKKVFDKKSFNEFHLLIGETPSFLERFGFDTSKPLMMTSKHARDILTEPDGIHDKYHGLSQKDLTLALSEMNDPVLVVSSVDSTGNENGTLMVLTSVRDKDNYPVGIYVHPVGKGYYNRLEIDSNFVKSVYGKKNTKGYISQAVWANRLLYLNKDKSQQLRSIPGIQFPNNIPKVDFNKNIARYKDIVKGLKKNTTHYSIGDEMQDESSASFNLQEKVKKAQEYFGTTSGFNGNDVTNNMGEEIRYSIGKDSLLMDRAERKNQSTEEVDDNILDAARKVRENIKEKYSDLFIADSMSEKKSPLVGNDSYAGSLDSSTVCTRSLTMESIVELVAKRIGRPLKNEESIVVAQELMEYTGDKAECLYCYQANAKRGYEDALSNFIDQRKTVIENHLGGMDKDTNYKLMMNYDFEKKKWGKTDTSAARERFNTFIQIAENKMPMAGAMYMANTRTLNENIKNKTIPNAIREQLKQARTYAQGAVKAHGRVYYATYNGQVLQVKQSKIDEWNRTYGLRMYSFSDFSPAFILENMQMVTDASVRGLRMLAYTKEQEFVEIFGGTGMAVNISIAGVADGKGGYYSDGMQGMDWDVAKDLRDRYPAAGTVYVAKDDAEVEWAMAQDWIDTVIPFHISYGSAMMQRNMGWKNYSGQQSEKKLPGWNKDNGDKITIYPFEHQNDKDAYIRLCKENNLSPRFQQFIDNVNYMKLVNETRLAPNEMSYVQPIFNEAAAEATLNQFATNGGYNPILGGTRETQEYIADDITAKVKARSAKVKENGSERLLYMDKKRSQNLAKVKKSSRYSIGTTDLKVDKETRDLITAHNTAMREVFYSRSRADQSELWDLIKDEMAHILKTGAARRKVVDDIVQLAYDTGYRIARRENEAVNTWGKGIYMPEKYTGEMASLGGLKAVNNQLMGSGLYFTYQRKKKDSNVNYGSLDEAYSDLSDANPMLPETMDPAEQVQAIIDLFGSKNRHQSLHELDEEAYEMGEDSKPYLTDIRNAVNEAMDDISTMARYKMIQAARKSGEAEGRKKGAAEQRKAQQKTEEATMREYDKLRQKLAKDERRDAEATMRMHDKLIEEVRKEERNLSEKEKADIQRKVKTKEREWDKEVKRQAAEFKREQRKKLRNADKNLDAALREAEKERKKREKYLSDAEKKNAQKRMKEIDAERRKERIETAKEEYRRNNPPPKTGTTADLYRKNNGARKIATDFRDKAISELVDRGVFVDTNGQVVLDENNQEVAYRSNETGKWDVSRYKNSYTPSWGLTLLAKKEGIDVDKFYTIYSQVMTMRTEQDDRGNRKYHKSDIVKYIGTLDITAKQKDFLYFDCAKYAYSTKPVFLSGGKTKVKAGNRRGHMIEALDNIAFDMFNGTVKQEEIIGEEVNTQLRTEDIAAFLDAVFGEDPSAEKEAYAEFFMKLVINSASEMELMRMAEHSNLLTDKPKEISQTKTRILQIYRQSKRMFLAEGEAYERMSDAIGDKLLTARYYGAKNALAIANEMIYGNTQRDLSGINKGKSLHEIFRPVFRADEKANNHAKMVALTELVNCRHDIYRLQYDKGYTGYSIEECEEVVERISNEFPELVKVADELVEYGRSLLRMCVDSGRISEEDYQYFVEKYPYYVPTFRVRSNEYIDRKGRVVRRDTKVIRTAQKSNVDVLPLFDQFVRRTQEIVKACKKNQLANELARAYMMNEAGDGRVEKYIYNISPASKDNTGDLQSQLDEISEIGEIEDRGTSERDTENNVIPWYSNGVKYNVEIADEGLLYGWDRISYRKDEIAVGTAIRKLNNIRRGLLTQYNPTFWLTNGIRDIQDMYMYNQNAQRLPKFHAIATKTMFAGSLSGTKAAKKMSKREMNETRKNEERLQEFFSFGVRASSIFEYDKTKSGVRSRGRRAVEGVKKYTLDAFDSLNFMVEQTPRFAVYLETVDRLEKEREKGKNSYTDEEIKTIASYQATDATLNFGRSGTIIKGMNTYGFTFLNAGVQGMDRFVRSFSQIKDKSKFAMFFNLVCLVGKMSLLGIAPGLILQNVYGSTYEVADAIRRALYGDDDDEIQKIMQEYYEMADYQKVNYYLFYINGTWYRIPRGRVMSWYYGASFHGIKTGRDDYDVLDFIADQWDLTTETILPSNPITNNILSPLIDVWRNKDNWDNDIVSEYEDMGEGMHYLEYDEDTTDLAIRIAKLGHYLTGTRFGDEFSRIIDISPKKLDYIVKQYFGSYADMIMPFLNKEQKVSDNLLGAIESMAKKFYIDPNASNRLAGDYYDLKEEYERIANAHDGDSPYAVASKIFNDYGDFLKEARNNIKVIENDTSLSRKERLEKISAIRKEMNQLYRDGMADAKSVLEYAKENYGQEGIDNSTLYETWIKENKSTDWRTNMATKSETEKLNKYRNLGMTDETAYLVMDTFGELEPYEGKESISNYQKMEAIAGLGLSAEQEKAAVGAALTSEKQYIKYLAMCDHVSTISASKWLQFQDALAAADAADDGNGYYNKDEKKAALDSCDFTNAERAVFWQSLDSRIGSKDYTTQWKANRNIYDKSVAAKMIDSYMERIVNADAAKAAANQAIANSVFPVGTDNYRISSSVGYRSAKSTNGVGSTDHHGIDISTKGVANVPAYSVTSGEVVSIGWGGGYGNCVIIQNDDGYASLYGHLASYDSNLKVGDKVTTGQQIGIIGSTGNSTGIHLHFEVRTNWEDSSSYIDPNTVYDIDGDGKLRDSSVAASMGTGTTNASYTGTGSSGSSSGRKSGGGSKKTTASSSANLATVLSGTQRKATGYDSITKTANSQSSGVYLPISKKTVTTASSRNVRGHSTKAEGYGSGGTYLPRAKQYNAIRNRSILSSVANTKRTGRTGGSLWNENVLG